MFKELTSGNIHWALNYNIEKAYEELRQKVPTSGRCTLEGPLVGDGSREIAISGVQNYGARSAFSENTESGRVGDKYKNYQTLSSTMEEVWGVLLKPVLGTPQGLREWWDETMAPYLVAKVTTFADGQVNEGYGGGAVSLPGSAPTAVPPLPSITLDGDLFSAQSPMWRMGSTNTMRLNYAETIPSGEFTLTMWIRVKKRVTNSNGLWSTSLNIRNANSTSVWADYLMSNMASHRFAYTSSGGIKVINSNNIWDDPIYPGLPSPPIIPNPVRVSVASGPMNPPATADDEVVYYIAIRHVQDQVTELVVNDRVVPVFPGEDTFSALPPTSAGLALTPSTVSDPPYKDNMEFGPIHVYDRYLLDTELVVTQMLRD